MKYILLTAALFTALPVCAQQTETKVKQAPPDAQVQGKVDQGVAEGMTQEEYDEATGEVINADGTVTRAGTAPALSSFAGFVVSTRPARLAPGQSGTLILVLSLQGEAIVLPGTSLALNYASNQGPLQLGAWTVQPPKPGKLYKQFINRPVHETYVQVEVPITIAQDAPYEKYPVSLDIEVEMVNGMSGASMGQKKGNVSHQVVVGTPMPTPAPRAHAAVSNGSNPEHSAGPSDVVGPGTPGTSTDAGRKPEVGMAQPGQTPGLEGASATGRLNDDPYVPAPSGSNHMLLYLVLGGTVLGLIVLFVARGKR